MEVKAIRLRDLVRDVVTQVAPEELPLVAGLAGFDDATAVRRLRGRDRRREPLGFGLGEVAALVTPVVWLALDQAVQRILGTWVDQAITGTGTTLRRLFRRPVSEPVTIPPLTPEQLALVRESVLTMAARRGLEPERATVIADAVVTRLVLVEAETDGTPELPGPDTPDAPDAPDTADAPDAPDTPDAPDRPERPDRPDAPNEP
ncbi:hypothetical protein QC334_00480 [Streptomyces sp. DH18]|uniref:hypothetical protein n=1 Tax=Streptomyces sp. DH18 TaxID=3040126 RepID=UPI002442CD0C|nr:hypothetical protein [Streptomyces sp. DH18]MDG9681223.1 hypothetical protein [Streptomyces sp. DH18]